MISFVPGRNYLFKVSNLSTRIRCESSSILRMSMLRYSSVVLVSLLFTVNTFQTLFYLLTLNRNTFACFILKSQTLFKTRSGILWIML